MPQFKTTEKRLDNLESQVIKPELIDSLGVPVVDITPFELKVASLEPRGEGAYITLIWFGWRPEIESYEVWATFPNGEERLVAKVSDSPASFTLNVEEETAVVFSIRALAEGRIVSLERSPSVAAAVPPALQGSSDKGGQISARDQLKLNNSLFEDGVHRFFTDESV